MRRMFSVRSSGEKPIVVESKADVVTVQHGRHASIDEGAPTANASVDFPTRKGR